MRNFYLLALTIIALSVGAPLISFAQEGSITKADKVLNSARKAVYKGVKLSDVKGLQVEKKITGVGEMEVLQPGKSKPQKNQAKINMKKEVLVSLPNRIKSLTKTFLPIPEGMDINENYLKAEIIANGKNISVKDTSVFEGQETDFESSLQYLPVSKKEKTKRLKEYKKLHAKKETLSYVQQQTWVDVFPPILFFPWDAKKQFKYLGKAKIGERKADILELVATKKEEAEVGKLRLFFDEKTHLLLMAIADMTTSKGVGTAKFFFSDYQLMDGLLIAKKLNTEASIKGADGSKQRTVQKIIIKDFKINPVFKAGTFEVKK